MYFWLHNMHFIHEPLAWMIGQLYLVSTTLHKSEVRGALETFVKLEWLAPTHLLCLTKYQKETILFACSFLSFSKYAGILASQGSVETAMAYLMSANDQVDIKG